MLAAKHSLTVNGNPDLIRSIMGLAVAGQMEIYPVPQFRTDKIFDPRFKFRPLHFQSPRPAYLTLAFSCGARSAFKAEGKRLLEKRAIAPSAARLCSARFTIITA